MGRGHQDLAGGGHRLLGTEVGKAALLSFLLGSALLGPRWMGAIVTRWVGERFQDVHIQPEDWA